MKSLRNTILAGAALAALLLAPAVAGADDPHGVKHDAQGKLMNMRGTYIGFDIKGNKVKNFSLTAPFMCTNPMIQTIPLPTKKVAAKVNKKTGKFSVKYKLKFEGVTMNVKISGKAKGKNYSGVASYKFKYNPFGKCTSGAMDWKARKGKKVKMPTTLSAGKVPALTSEGGLR